MWLFSGEIKGADVLQGCQQVFSAIGPGIQQDNVANAIYDHFIFIETNLVWQTHGLAVAARKYAGCLHGTLQRNRR